MMGRYLDRYGRYVVISFLTGCIDYLLALVLLNAGEPPAVSLGIAIVIAGVIDYVALEKWGFSGRSGSYSLKRLLQSALVEGGTYLIRLGVLTVWQRVTPAENVIDHAVGLAVAFGAGFIFGYVVRSRMIFKEE